MFYSCPLELREFQLNEDERLQKLKYWHKMTITGSQFLVLFRIVLWAYILFISMWFPQPRSSYVIFCFLCFCLWFHFLRPFFVALWYTSILTKATNSSSMDGWFSWYTGIMDFLYTGVETAEFLTWRMHRIAKEELVMKQVHISEFAENLRLEVMMRKKGQKLLAKQKLQAAKGGGGGGKVAPRK